MIRVVLCELYLVETIYLRDSMVTLLSERQLFLGYI